MDHQKTKVAAKSLLMPFTLTAIIIIADQISKLLIVKTIQVNTIGVSILNDFIRIIHTRNLGIAFSIGYDLPDGIRTALFILFPALVIVAVVFFYFKEKDLTYGMRWALAGIVGGQGRASGRRRTRCASDLAEAVAPSSGPVVARVAVVAVVVCVAGTPARPGPAWKRGADLVGKRVAL